MKPSVGRIVHFRQRPDSECFAGVVVTVHADDDYTVDVHVFPSLQWGGGLMVATKHARFEGAAGWHWPERV